VKKKSSAFKMGERLRTGSWGFSGFGGKERKGLKALGWREDDGSSSMSKKGEVNWGNQCDVDEDETVRLSSSSSNDSSISRTGSSDSFSSMELIFSSPKMKTSKPFVSTLRRNRVFTDLSDYVNENEEEQSHARSQSKTQTYTVSLKPRENVKFMKLAPKTSEGDYFLPHENLAKSQDRQFLEDLEDYVSSEDGEDQYGEKIVIGDW
jgi:hypothetical protein